MIGDGKNILNSPLPDSPVYNSAYDMLKRGNGLVLTKEVTITGTGVVKAQVLKVIGSVQVLRQWAIITEVTTLTNMTDVYADVYDGTVAADLTKSPGIVLSGAPVGTFFTRDKDSTNTYSVNISDQVRFSEATLKRAVPFIVTQKNGVDSFIRFNFTTTDSPVSFKMLVFFEYYPLNGGTLEFL